MNAKRNIINFINFKTFKQYLIFYSFDLVGKTITDRVYTRCFYTF